MNINLIVNDQENWVQIDIKGKLDSNDFYEATKTITTIPFNNDYDYMIDLSQTEFIDSTGLSLLLILRDHVGGDEANVILTNCRESLISLLKMFNYDKLFTLVR